MNVGPLLIPATIKPRAATRVAAPPKPRGFAAMDPAKQKAISSKGGKAAQASGRGRRMTREEAREAGRIGGQRSRRGPAKAKV